MQTLLRLEDAPDLMLPDEAARVMRCGYRRALELCHAPGFPAMKIGRRYVISREGLRCWLQTQAGAGR